MMVNSKHIRLEVELGIPELRMREQILIHNQKTEEIILKGLSDAIK